MQLNTSGNPTKSSNDPPFQRKSLVENNDWHLAALTILQGSKPTNDWLV
jgi:hypothetical protein